MPGQLANKRVLLLGAETEAGGAVAQALAAEGAALAIVASSPGAETAFAVQRLARRLNAVAQAIDAGNEAAVRVMVRQVSKQLGGLDAIVFCADRTRPFADELRFAVRFGAKDLARTGGTFVAVDVEPWEQPPGEEMRIGMRYISFPLQQMPTEQAVAWTLHAVAGAAKNG
jgi:NAD(P)-dependent dehydrogenase (short-subunit alcohol dehydrogenase family)